MPKTADTTVILNITGGAPPSDKWKACKKGTGVLDGYWYLFSGGNSVDNDGSWEFTVDSTGNGNKFIDVKLECADGWDPQNPTSSQGYRITGIPITYDGAVTDDKKDITIKSDTDPRCWQLKDKNKDAESGEFKVVVSYTFPGVNPVVVSDIECDPGWKNKN